MSVFSTTPNYKIHPLDVVEKFENSFGKNKKFALLRIVFGEEIPEDIVDSYKKQIEKHNEAQINSEFATVGFELITYKKVYFTDLICTKKVDFGIKCEMWYRENDSYRYSPFHLMPTMFLLESPIIMQSMVIETNYRDSIMVPLKYISDDIDKIWTLTKGSQPVKIYHPSLCPLYILVEENGDNLTRIA